jgi:hypothetical protein
LYIAKLDVTKKDKKGDSSSAKKDKNDDKKSVKSPKGKPNNNVIVNIYRVIIKKRK